MVNFEEDKELQIINVKVNDIIKWSHQKLKQLFGYDFKVWCNPQIGKNLLNFNIDETEMTDEQWVLFSKSLETTDGYSDYNLKRLLIKLYGEAEYTFKVHELDQFYIIRHVKASQNVDFNLKGEITNNENRN